MTATATRWLELTVLCVLAVGRGVAGPAGDAVTARKANKAIAEGRSADAVALLDPAIEESRDDAERADLLELRSLALTVLARFDEAEADLAAADLLYGRLGDGVGRARCLRRGAYTAWRRGDAARALLLLDRQRPHIAIGADGAPGTTELRTHEYLRSLACLGVGDLDAAAAAIERFVACSAKLLLNMPWTEVLRSHELSAPATAVLIDALLTHAREHPEDEPRVFALVAAVAETAKARLLRTALQNPVRADAGRVGPPRALPAGVVMLRFLETANETTAQRRYALLASRDGEQRCFDLGSMEVIDAAVDDLLERRLSIAALSDEPAVYAQAAHGLAVLLLGPAIAWLEDSGVSRVVVLADGSLARVPFDALVLSPARSPADHGALDYVVRHAAVVHLPSLGVLDGLRPPSQERRAVALLAPLIADDDAHLRFARLEEAALRLGHRDVAVLSGAAATIDGMVAQLRAAPAGWLHLACHAEPDPLYHDYARMRLAPGDHDDGSLRASEILVLPLTPGARVILSACGTASGDYVRGEGVLGVWRAFLGAGASCVVSTLRDVDDRCAATWMAEFHTRAVAGKPLAEAARGATLAWLDGTARPVFPRGARVSDPTHPALWAAYICIGDDGGPLPARVP